MEEFAERQEGSGWAGICSILGSWVSDLVEQLWGYLSLGCPGQIWIFEGSLSPGPDLDERGEAAGRQVPVGQREGHTEQWWRPLQTRGGAAALITSPSFTVCEGKEKKQQVADTAVLGEEGQF